MADVYELYERDLHRMNAMDFDDLLFRTVNVLELFEEVRERYAQAFRHVLVDEYQDTNHAQYRLLQLGSLARGRAPRLTGHTRAGRAYRRARPGHRNLAVVGDDDQSIYRFRGADVRNILDFHEDFPDARVVKLEQNYRSTQTILSRRQRGDRQQPRRDRQAAVERAGQRQTRSSCAGSRTSTPRRASSWARSSGWSTRAPRARRSPCSTGPTRCRA